MLNITVPSSGESKLTFSALQRYNLPLPANGAYAEVNDDVVLKFDDEEDALDYAGRLEDFSSETEERSPQRIAINDMILAIQNDEFVKSYMQQN